MTSNVFEFHVERYLDGKVHTNGVMPFHLFRYLDEESFRYNERKGKDGRRFLES